MTQASLLDYCAIKIDGDKAWQLPLREYLASPASWALPKNSILDIDLSGETPEGLMRLSSVQLAALCIYWSAPWSGTKAKKIENLFGSYGVYRILTALGQDGLMELTVPEVREMYRRVRRSSGSWFTKRGLIECLLVWRDTVHESFFDRLGRERHYDVVVSALRLGEPVPDEVIRSHWSYQRPYRIANGLPVEPEEMTGAEWAEYVKQASEHGYRTDAGMEVERHWRIVKRAIKEGKKLKPEVVADHEQRTRAREAEKEKATPRGPEWVPADIQKLHVGDVVYRTDGMKMVIRQTDPIVAFNTDLQFSEAPSQGRVWHKTPFRVGDMVRWTAPDGKVRTGRIKHARPQHPFGEEFFIETGRKIKGFDQPEFFVAPVVEVEKN